MNEVCKLLAAIHGPQLYQHVLHPARPRMAMEKKAFVDVT